MPETREVRIDALKFDYEHAPRELLNDDTIDTYAGALKRGDVFPAIDVFWDGSAYWIADGWHRTNAHKDIGRETILANVHHGTQRDARFFAAQCNRTHGLQRSPEDKRRAIEILLNDAEWVTMSNIAISEHVGVSQYLVKRVRDEGPNRWKQNIRTGRNGKLYRTHSSPASPPKETEPDPLDLRWSGLGGMSSTGGDRDVLYDRERIPVPSYLQRSFNRVRHTVSDAFHHVELAVIELEKVETDDATRLLDIGGLIAQLRAVQDEMKAGYPHCMCPRRLDDGHGDDCEFCRGGELVSEEKVKALDESDREKLEAMRYAIHGTAQSATKP